MKTITLLISQQARARKLAGELAAAAIRCGVPFHYYVTAGGYPRFRFTFDCDFSTLWQWCQSRGLEGEFVDGCEEP